MPGETYPGQSYPGGGGLSSFGSVPLSRDINVSYLYKIYDADFNFLGVWNDVVSDFGYSQEINSAGSAIEVVLARNSDTLDISYQAIGDDSNDPIVTDDDAEIAAELTSTNSIGPGTTVDLNLNVKIYEFNKNTTSPEGDLVFTGYISKYVSQYGTTEQTKVSLFSYGADMDNWVIEKDGDTRVPYFSRDPAHILRDALDRFEADGGLITYEPGTTNYETITNLIDNPSLEVDTTNWSTLSGTTGRASTVAAQVGTYYYNVFSGLGKYTTTANLVSGQEYDFSFYGQVSANTGTYTIKQGTTTIASGSVTETTWTRHTDTFTAIANTPFIVEFGMGTSQNFRIDALQLTQGDTTYPYFDGNTTDTDIYDYAWTGTTGKSTSTRQMVLGYTGGSIEDVTDTVPGYEVTYTFNVNTMLEVLKKCLELAPADWFFYVDLADNVVTFKPRPTVPDHTFLLGKHILSLSLEKYIEDITNTVYFSGGDTGGGENLFKKYEDAASIASYRRGLKRISDGRVTLEASADILSEGEIDRNKNPRYRSSVTISSYDYDIRTIKLGDLIGFRNFNNFVDSVTMQVVRIDYRGDQAVLQLDTLLPSVPKRLEDIKRNLSQQEVSDNPDAPTT